MMINYNNINDSADGDWCTGNNLKEPTFCGKFYVTKLRKVAETRRREPRTTLKEWRERQNNNNNTNIQAGYSRRKNYI